MTFKKRFLQAFTFSAVTCLTYGQAIASDSTNRLIVKFKPATVAKAMASTASRSNTPVVAQQMARPLKVDHPELSYHRQMTTGAVVMHLPASLELDEARQIADKISQRDDVAYAIPDERRYPAMDGLPRDYSPEYQWYIDRPGVIRDSFGINAVAAWPMTNNTSNGDVVIAVIDTGFTEHNDIDQDNRYVAGYDFISADPVLPGASDAERFFTANDGDGRDADASDPGDWAEADECFSDASSQDSSWHGTLVAGMIGAKVNNTFFLPNRSMVGAVGDDDDIKIQHVRALGRCGGYISDIADAILWSAGVSNDPVANSTPAKVINLSLGSPQNCTRIEQEAVNLAVEAGAIVVAAAGNASDVTAQSSPASCANVIAVGATSYQGGQPNFTNLGPKTNISAPGGNDVTRRGRTNRQLLLTTSNTGLEGPEDPAYQYVSGTSFSTPLVAATLAMMLDVNPALTPQQLYGTMTAHVNAFPRNTTDGSFNCTATRCGVGIVNTEQAVLAAANGNITTAELPPLGTFGGEIDTITPDDDGSGSGALPWSVLFGLSLLMAVRRRISAS